MMGSLECKPIPAPITSVSDLDQKELKETCYLTADFNIEFEFHIQMFIQNFSLRHTDSFRNTIQTLSLLASTRRRFDVYTTSITLKRCRMDVKTTLCAYWAKSTTVT